MRVLLVGIGGAGTQVADRIADAYAPDTLWERILRWFFPPHLDLEVLVADAPEAGGADLLRLSREEIVPLGEGAGAGGDLEAGARAWRRDGGALRDAAGETDPWDLALVVGAVGGGTAGAAMGSLVETLQALGRDAPVVAAPILPFEDEADRIHRNAAPALRRIREADPLGTILLSNERLGTARGRLADVYAGANAAVVGRLRHLLDLLSGPGLRAADLGALETTLDPGSGFAVLGYARAEEQADPGDVMAEALSPEAASAEAHPGEEASRVLLLVRGDPDDLAMEALLDRAREVVPDREILLGVRAASGEPLEVLAVVALQRSRAMRAVLDRHDAIVAATRGPEEDPVGERLAGIPDDDPGVGGGEEPDGGDGGEDDSGEDEGDGEEAGWGGEEEDEDGGDPGEGDGGEEGSGEDEEGEGEPPEWVEDYRAAQQKAKELDIKANQKHVELIGQIREAQGEDPP